MLYLETIEDPLAEESLIIQEAILNSDQYYLKKAEGKQALTRENIIEDILENLTFDAKFSFIKNEGEYLGFIYYILDKPHEHYCWLSLFIIHEKFQKNRNGYKSYQLFEKMLREQHSIEKIRLCAHIANERGTNFWFQNGYERIGFTWDKKSLPINIYEKAL
jgi:hypothetical protein